MEVRILYTKADGTTTKTTLTDVDEITKCVTEYEDGVYKLYLVCNFGPIGRQNDEEQDEWGNTGNYDESGWNFYQNQGLFFLSRTPIKMSVAP